MTTSTNLDTSGSMICSDFLVAAERLHDLFSRLQKLLKPLHEPSEKKPDTHTLAPNVQCAGYIHLDFAKLEHLSTPCHKDPTKTLKVNI